LEAYDNDVHRPYSNYLKHAKNITKYGWLIFLCLFVEDLFVRGYFTKQPVFDIVLLQGILFFISVCASIIKAQELKRNLEENSRSADVLKSIEVVLTVCMIGTMYHSVFFYFVALLPITFKSLTKGFKKTIPFIIVSWVLQIAFQYSVFLWLGNINVASMLDKGVYYAIIITIQYIIFSLFCYIWGGVYEEYVRSEEENNILIDRLGDKYVQLEQAKKEIQAQYDKIIESNTQLEEANKKLTASLAEFYTLQQISQAITSIFDMNELLKFVNDVIIGVMGVYHSTIALCYGPQNRLKVQVSSIFDKKDLAIVSDYINCETLKPSTEEGRSMIDNNVNPEDYPFTKGRNIKSMICVPLIAKGKTLGIVLIEHSIENAFNDENMRLLEVIAQQISIAIENARLYQQMHDLATLDGLTGAYNRLFFNDKLQEEFKKAQEKGYDLSCIIFDIDHFKKFNDTYGHLFGDLVLKTMSAHIMKTLRKEDIFARYGGEEFVILLPYTSLEQAKEKAEDLRIGVSQLSITDRVVSASVTISVGVSTFPVTARSAHELISTADNALYEAKNAGRNRVRTAQKREN